MMRIIQFSPWSIAVVASLRPYMPTTFFAVLIFYFGVQALTGDRGLLTGPIREETLAQRTGELKRLQTERVDTERKVRLLGEHGLSRDLLDERARAVLGFADPREYVVRISR